MLMLASFLLFITSQMTLFMVLFFPILVAREGLLIPSSNRLLLSDNTNNTSKCQVLGDCGACNNVSHVGGIIESVRYPDEYGPDLNCSFSIDAPDGKRIQLTFEEFVVEKCCDFLSIYDGDETRPIQSRLNGYKLPDVLTSSSDSIIVKFTSNSNNTLVADVRKASLGPPRWKASFVFLDKTTRKT